MTEHVSKLEVRSKLGLHHAKMQCTFKASAIDEANRERQGKRYRYQLKPRVQETRFIVLKIVAKPYTLCNLCRVTGQMKMRKKVHIQHAIYISYCRFRALTICHYWHRQVPLWTLKYQLLMPSGAYKVCDRLDKYNPASNH